MEDRGAAVRLRVGPRHLAALSLRPVDAAGLESVSALLAAVGDGDGGRVDGLRLGTGGMRRGSEGGCVFAGMGEERAWA